MYSWIFTNVLYPTLQLRYKQNHRSLYYFKYLEKSQWWPIDSLLEYQKKRLKELIQFAYHNVPYYHKIFKNLNIKPSDITNVSDLKRLPILTKDLIRNNVQDLIPKKIRKTNLINNTTSGSTGEPLSFYIDNSWLACNEAAAYRQWKWADYTIGDKMLYLWGAPQDFSKQKNLEEKINNLLFRIKKINSIDMDWNNMQHYLDTIKSFKPNFINTYSSSIFLLAKYMKKHNITYNLPNGILTTADMLYEHQRKIIEDAFQTKIFDYYSGRDTTLQAGECAYHSGYHLSIENAVVEFINDGSVSVGETGKIIITDLCNYAFPFIRYEIGDLGIPSDEKCNCGRGLPIMKSLEGRTFDYIVAPNGKVLNGEFFHYTIIHHNIQGIREFQVFQQSKDKMILKVVVNPINDVSKFVRLIKKSIGEEMDVDVEYTPFIKRTASGKLRHVISKINI